MRKSSVHIARVLFVFWAIAQLTFLTHHHEVEEEHCEHNSAHYCETHVEAHDCDWCHVITQVYEAPSTHGVSDVLEVREVISVYYRTDYCNSIIRFESRGPPALG